MSKLKCQLNDDESVAADLTSVVCMLMALPLCGYYRYGYGNAFMEIFSLFNFPKKKNPKKKEQCAQCCCNRFEISKMFACIPKVKKCKHTSQFSLLQITARQYITNKKSKRAKQKINRKTFKHNKNKKKDISFASPWAFARAFPRTYIYSCVVCRFCGGAGAVV